jgi:dynactin complex subunit
MQEKEPDKIWYEEKTRRHEGSSETAGSTADLEKENASLRGKLKELSGELNRIRASIDSVLWPNSGFVSVDK